MTTDTTIKLMVKTMYRSYFNDFLTTQGFADYYGISREFARAIIKEGKNND